MSDDEDDSELGKKSYWDDMYERELANLELNGDEGEVWWVAVCSAFRLPTEDGQPFAPMHLVLQVW